MKKNLLVILGIFIIIISSIYFLYSNYRKNIILANKVNQEYESYCQDEILGTSLMTLINKATNQNEENNVQKDSKNRYIQNDKNSIVIQVKFLESEEIFSMESISLLGASEFIKNYNNKTFKCVQKEYHQKTKNISYMLFEEFSY